MRSESALQELARELVMLRDALRDLRVTVVEDKPVKGDSVLVDVFGDTADDIVGWLEEALAAAGAAADPADGKESIEKARRALVVCHDRYDRAVRLIATELLSYERVADLTSLGRERGGKWAAWVVAVKEALDRCQPVVFDVNRALLRSWERVADQAAGSRQGVRVTAIGEVNNVAVRGATRARASVRGAAATAALQAKERR